MSNNALSYDQWESQLAPKKIDSYWVWDSPFTGHQHGERVNKYSDDQNMELYRLYLTQQSEELAAQRTLSAQKADRDFNASEAQKMRDWYDNQRNTAYQTAVQDMRKAGLNPILALGSPAASSASSAASYHSSGFSGTSYSGGSANTSSAKLASQTSKETNILSNIVNLATTVVSAYALYKTGSVKSAASLAASLLK